MKLNVAGIEIDGAVEGPNGLKVWPPQLLKKTLDEFKNRHEDVVMIKRKFANKGGPKKTQPVIETISLTDFDNNLEKEVAESLNRIKPYEDEQ